MLVLFFINILRAHVSVVLYPRAVLMAMWSKALPLTACLLSFTTAWVRIPAAACEKVASDLGLGGGFPGYFPPPSHLVTPSPNMAKK